MANNSKGGFSKFILYTGSLIGIGVIGALIYNKKVTNKVNYSSIDKHNLSEELRTFFNADCSYNRILLECDYEKISTKNIDSVFDLKSIQFAQELYYKSREFNTEEVRELIKTWYLTNIKIVEGYLGRIDAKNVNKSIQKLDRDTSKLEKLIVNCGLYDKLGEDCEIQEAVIGSFVMLNHALENGNELAEYITKLNSKNTR